MASMPNLPGGTVAKTTQWWGIYFGYVSSNSDPTDSGRLKLRVPQVLGTAVSGWATPMVPLTYVPPIGALVAVMFVGGDPTQPVYFGNFAIPAPGTPASVSTEPPADPSMLGSAGGGNQMFVWNGQDTGNQTLPTGQVIPNGWVAYNLGTAAIASGVGLTEPAITGGTITGSVFEGTNWEENSSGSFFYAGPAAYGNLIASITPYTPGNAITTTTLDQYGNAVLAGSTSYSLGPSDITAVLTVNGGINFLQAATSAGPYSIETSLTYGQVDDPGVVTGLLIGNQPTEFLGQLIATEGTASSPTLITTDTWHNATGLPSGYSGRARYRMTIEGELELDVLISTSSTAAAANTTLFTLPTTPVSYTPTVQSYWPCAVTVSGVTQAGAAYSSGSSVVIATASASRIAFCLRIPMS
jgi:hypothetical protein